MRIRSSLIHILVGGALLALALYPVLSFGTGGHARAQSERLQVIATHSILADVISNVAGEAATVDSLMPLFADPHAYTPTPQDLVRLASSDAVFVVGAGFEENLSVTLDTMRDGVPIITASLCVDILPFGAADDHAEAETPAPQADSPVAAQCDAHRAEIAALMRQPQVPNEAESAGETLGPLYALDCGDAHNEEDGDHAHEAGSCDPHVWTDPHNAMLWALMARDTLSELDPAHADIYAANTATYLEALRALIEDEIQPLLANIPPENRVLVTNHVALNYFARAFDLRVIGTVLPGASTLAEPGAADLARLIETIREAGVPAVFAETTANPTLAEQVTRETGARLYMLYTGSLSEPGGPAATYLDYMRTNTRLIADALMPEDTCEPCTERRP
ncbi:MAG: metal ABC transporter substrate-binding protein [Anaerolineae bacterium]